MPRVGHILQINLAAGGRLKALTVLGGASMQVTLNILGANGRLTAQGIISAGSSQQVTDIFDRSKRQALLQAIGLEFNGRQVLRGELSDDPVTARQVIRQEIEAEYQGRSRQVLRQTILDDPFAAELPPLYP
jgi:hypothetical protein